MKLPEVPELSIETIEEAGKYLHDDRIMEIVSRYNERYLHWEELKYRKLPADPEIIWNLMKKSRALKAKSLKFGNRVFRYSLIDEFQEKLHILDKTASGNLLSKLESLQDDRKKYIISSLMEEAIASSQIEGAATTRDIAKRMLRENRKPRNNDEKMIANNYATMKHITELKNEAITPEKILELHGMITHGLLEKPEYEGNFRENNEIAVYSQDGTLLHTPVEYGRIPDLIDELCAFANSEDKEFIHPVIKGIIIHFLVGYIHPFNDGNGRTARALFYWFLLKKDYWLFEYMAVSKIINSSKKQYRNAYLYSESDKTPTDSGDLTYFIKYNLNCTQKALSDVLEYLDRKKQEQAQALRIIKESETLNLRQVEILKQFLKQPEKPVTIKEIVTTYSVAYATARSDLFHLEELGYIEKKKAGKEFIFIFKGID
ncbi:MAG: Fic family protein, partial [Methanosarcinaceae archaeon]|nr:Fic family protein [Methanosarcinaceae archaeon]